jgi:hypothetical protein
MERMLNERLPARGGWVRRQHSPANSHGGVHDENSVGGDDDYYFGHRRGHGGCHGHGGHGGGARGHDFHPHVHFNDEDFHEISDHDMEYNDNENPFTNHGPFGQHHDHRQCASHGGHELPHHHHRDETDNLARIKMQTLNGKNNVIKFAGCMISLTGGVSTLILLSFQAMHSLGGIKSKTTNLYWGVLILKLGLR